MLDKPDQLAIARAKPAGRNRHESDTTHPDGMNRTGTDRLGLRASNLSSGMLAEMIKRLFQTEEEWKQMERLILKRRKAEKREIKRLLALQTKRLNELQRGRE